MKTSKLNYPRITEQQEHQAANEKLVLFMDQHREAQKLLDRLNTELAARFNKARPEDGESAISAADALLDGKIKGATPQQITDAERAVDILEKAIKAQQLVLADVTRTLSIEAGKALMPQHKAIVKKIAAAIQTLHEANTEEWAMRNEFVRLGYTGHTVPTMQYELAADPNDNTGSAAYYWMKHIAPYVEAATSKPTAPPYIQAQTSKPTQPRHEGLCGDGDRNAETGEIVN